MPDEFLDVGDEDHRSFIFVESFGDDGEVSEVDMVGRLIEDEESWFFERELREHDESLLSFAERSDRSRHDLTCDEKSCCK